MVNFKPQVGFENYFLGSNNIIIPPVPKNSKVHDLIDQEIAKLEGHWAVAIKDLKSEEVYFYRENERFPSASLYKLALMWATYAAIAKNQLSPDQVISEDKITLDQILEGNIG